MTGQPEAKSVHSKADQALFGIVQVVSTQFYEHRREALKIGLDFAGYGIGGLSVGESRQEMMPALRAAISELPEDKSPILDGRRRPGPNCRRDRRRR